MPRKFSTAILDTLLKTVEVEFKVPLLGFGEIKFPVSEHAKDWWKNEKAREELLESIDTAEQKFITQHPDNKAAQILKDFSLKNEEEFQKIIAELLNHLDQQKITWLMADKLGKGFESIVSNKELQNALNDYIPILQNELGKIKEFREVISYLLQKQIASTTSLTYETTKEIKGMLEERRGPKIKRIEKTVFISYRRTNFPWAYCIYQDLTHHGFDVFFDYQSIDSGNFEKVILENIKARAHFIIILSPSALERCDEPGDWLRREIETAIDEERNIIPVMLEGFDFGSPSVKNVLTGKLASLSGYSGMSLIAEYVEAGFEKLRTRFLNVALENVHLHVLPEEAREITESQKATARAAPPIEEAALAAQEWFERGAVFHAAGNFDEAIRCLTEAIKLQPNNPYAYQYRGSAYGMKVMPTMAIKDYSESIRLGSDLGTSYYGRGLAHQATGDLINAAMDLEKAVELKADDGSARASLMSVLRKLGRNDQAEEQERIARELIKKEDSYDQACFEAICGNSEIALAMLKLAFEEKPHLREWARQDPDFENIRDDPRFKGLVSE